MMGAEQLHRRAYQTVADDCGLRVKQVAQLVRWMTALPTSLDTDYDATLADLAAVVGCRVDQADHVARELIP